MQLKEVKLVKTASRKLGVIYVLISTKFDCAHLQRSWVRFINLNKWVKLTSYKKISINKVN